MSSNDKFKNAPRVLTLNAAWQVWLKAKPNKFDSVIRRLKEVGDDPEPSDLPTGFELLHSFYAPGLMASSEVPINTIKITQTIDPKDPADKPLTLDSAQEFVVIAPQFSLPAGDIHSVYPPQGSAAAAAILPHVVFNDPHLPWERWVIDPAKEKEPKRNKTPWMALMAFTADEILLDPKELAGPDRIFASDVQQNPTLSITQKVGDLTAIRPENAKNCVPQGTDPATTADFVFMTPQAFNSYFASDPPKTGVPAAQTQPDLSPYRFTAHSRAINTAGMADAGTQDDGLYSVVVSRRCGVWDNKVPVPIYVHLVSIDEAEKLAPWPMDGTKHVALCSLYSWTYQCLPPESVDIHDALKELGATAAMLGPPAALSKQWKADSDPIKKLLGQRLQDGFTLSRYLLQDGEETAAFYRGPLTPTAVDWPLTSTFPKQSTYSTDLQILDSALGIMDITYSTAWQLGRVLGLADQAFFTALSRLRTAIHSVALDKAKKTILADAHRTGRQVAASLMASFETLRHLTATREIHPRKRWNRPRPPPPDLSLWSSEMQAAFAVAVSDTVADFASSPDGGYYNELNRSANADYAIVLKWVLDHKFLFGIPAHYLIPDPSHLPVESLRFFQIDQNWVDALVDGALSLANHTDQAEDPVRSAIQGAIKSFIDTPDPVLGYKPQIPTYGFLLRSNIVTQFPDLHVDIPFTSKDTPKATLLRHENIDQGVMLVLIDRLPGDKELTGLALTQPPHQQRFAAAATVGIEPGAKPPVLTPTFEVEHMPVFTISDPPSGDAGQNCGPKVTFVQGGTYDNPLFDFETRLINIDNFAQHVFNNLKQYMPKTPVPEFTDTVATAAMMAIQLNDPVYRVNITFPGIPAPPSAKPDTPPTFAVTHRSIKTSATWKYGIAAHYADWIASQGTSHVKPQGLAGGHVPRTISTAEARSRPRNAPPPHYRTIHFKRLPLVAFTDDPPADKPKFSYGMWPVGAVTGNVGSDPPPIPITKTLQDLVISIQLPPDQREVGNFFLSKIVVVIPYGEPNNPAGRTNLFKSYRGIGPTMLSNVRFNVHTQYDSDVDGPLMKLSIIPRRVSGVISIKLINEMSILLPEVEVNAYTKPGLSVMCQMWEWYTFQPDQGFSSPLQVYLDIK